MGGRRIPAGRRPLAIATACALGLGLAGCTPGEGELISRTRRVAIVITIDSLRASRIGAYGYARPTTPSLDRFARRAHRFTRAYSPSSWTKPSMASLFLARPVHEHLTVLSLARVDEVLRLSADTAWDRETKERTLGRGMVVPRRLAPFHEGLVGFRKGAFLNNPHLAPDFGFDRSWDRYRMFPPKAPRRDESRAEEIHEGVLRFLDEHPEESVYVWIHHNDVHHPYGPVGRQAGLLGQGFSEDEFRFLSRPDHKTLVARAEDDPRLRRLVSALYDAGLREFDERLGTFFDGLRARGVFDESLILVTADHGEEFWEHGVFGHGFNLFAPTSGAPLLLKLPGQDTGGVVDEPVSLIDVGPTVLDFAGTSPPDPVPGRSLLPVVRGERQPERSVLSELVQEGYEIALVRGHWKLRLVFDGPDLLAHAGGAAGPPLEPRVKELYDLAADPEEKRPLPLVGHETLVAGLEDEIYDAIEGQPNVFVRLEEAAASGEHLAYPELLERQRGPRFRKLEEQLKALGYL